MKKVCTILGILVYLLVGSCNSIFCQTTKEEAIDKVLTEIIVDEIGFVNAYVGNNVFDGSQSIQLADGSALQLPYSENWVFFIDDIPFAYWNHKCRFIIFNKNDITYSIIDESIFPSALYTDFELIESVTMPIYSPPSFNPTLVGTTVPKNSHCYAVLIAGVGEGWNLNVDRSIWYNLSNVYNTLIKSYGFSKENIIVHYVNGSSTMVYHNKDLDGDQIQDDIDFNAHRSALENTFNALSGDVPNSNIAPVLGPEDVLFVYSSGHGAYDISQQASYMYLYDDNHNTDLFFDYELADLMKNIKCSQIIVMMNQCESGHFRYALTNPTAISDALCKNRVVHCASRIDEIAYAETYMTNLYAGEFTWYWCSAARGYYPDPMTPWSPYGFNVGEYPFLLDNRFPPLTANGYHDGKPDYNPDYQINGGNGDGIIQMEEAFNYANYMDSHSTNGYYTPYDGGGGWIIPPETPERACNNGFIADTYGSLYSITGIAGSVNTSQTVEPRNYVINGNLIIGSGASVTMNNGTYYFWPSSCIRINTGSEMILDHTYLTTDNDVDDLSEVPQYWKGIEVAGDNTSTQIPSTNQGKITLTNGAKIENANIGIFVGVPLYPSLAGGIVHCDSAYFINNIVAAQFEPYSFTENSYFTHTNFITNQSPLPNGENPDYFVKLYGVSPVRLNGCSFVNTHAFTTNNTEQGNGLLSSDSRFLISEYCISNESPCIHKRQTVFQNLNRGIYATNSSSIISPEIVNTFFYDNAKGLYLSGFTGLSSPTVIDNTFRVYKPGTNPAFDSYGMYLDQCSGFHVEENSFLTEGSTPDGNGLIVNSCGGEPNKIYRNTFTNLNNATIAQNINRNNTRRTGLCYKCNTFSSNTIDIGITKDPGGPSTPDYGIAPNQGYYLPDQGLSINTAPAGNSFSSVFSGHQDIHNSLNSFIYYYHGLPLFPPVRLKPDYPTVYGYTNTAVTNASFVTDPNLGALSCPSTVDIGGGGDNKDLLIESENKSDSLESILTALVDGGSTAALAMEVQNSTPPEALPTRNELMSNSPYLSDSVMKVATAKEDVLDNAMIRDILVANPQSAKSDEIINSLEDRITQMPDYMMEQILEGENTVGAKEIQEAQKAFWEGEHWFAYQNLINLYKGDSILTPNADSIVNLLESEDALVSSYDLVSWHYNTGNKTQAQNILNSIPSLFSLSQEQQAINQDYLNLYEVKDQISNNSSGSYLLDTTQINALQDIAINDPDMPGVFARNMLLASNNIQYDEPIFLPDDGLKSSKIEKYRGVKTNFDKESSYLKVFPNPAKDFFIAEFHLPSHAQNATLLITDESGKIHMNLLLNYSEDQKIIQTTDLTTGIYQVSLLIDGKVKGNSKIDLLK